MGAFSLNVVVHNSQQTFTNGDIVSGAVELSIQKALALSSLQVKLEGVAYTEFYVQETDKKRKTKEVYRTDTHKFLYDSVVVFPPEKVRQVSSSKEFTLAPGNYTYDFSFTIPSRTACTSLKGISNSVSFNMNTFDLEIKNGIKKQLGGYLPSQNDSVHQYHLVTPLPPTMAQKNMAKVSYFVKATCNRPSLFKVNLRHERPFRFMPLEQPAPPGREAFFRTPVVFSEKKGVFGRFSRPETTFAFEMRLRSPAQISPSSVPNIRLFVVSTGPSSVYHLNRLTFDLLGTTYISVVSQQNGRNEASQARVDDTIPLFDSSFPSIALDFLRAKPTSAGYELEIPQKHFLHWSVPQGVYPSFETCNIKRTYSLRVIANISDNGESVLVDVVCPEIAVLSGKTASSQIPYAENPQKTGGQKVEYPPEKQSYAESSKQTYTDTYKQDEGQSSALPSYDDATRQ